MRCHVVRAAHAAGRAGVATHVVADLDARVAQIDAAIAKAMRPGRTTGAMSIMEARRRARAGLEEERNREAGSLAILKAERASLAAKGRQAETEAAPIRDVAELVGGLRKMTNREPTILRGIRDESQVQTRLRIPAVVIRPHAALARGLSSRGKWSG
jgi:hypothetical protein